MRVTLQKIVAHDFRYDPRIRRNMFYLYICFAPQEWRVLVPPTSWYHSTRTYDVRYQEVVNILTRGEVPIDYFFAPLVVSKVDMLLHQHNTYA